MKIGATEPVALVLLFVCGAPNLRVAAQSSNAGRNKPSSPSLSHMLLVYADTDCDLSIDGESPRSITAGQPSKVPVDLGQHIVICSAEGKYRQTQEITISNSDPQQTILNISLAQQIAASEATKKQEDDAPRLRESSKQRKTRKITWSKTSFGDLLGVGSVGAMRVLVRPTARENLCRRAAAIVNGFGYALPRSQSAFRLHRELKRELSGRGAGEDRNS